MLSTLAAGKGNSCWGHLWPPAGSLSFPTQERSGCGGTSEEGARSDEMKRENGTCQQRRERDKEGSFSLRAGGLTRPRAPDTDRDGRDRRLWGGSPARRWVCRVLEPVPPGSPGRGSQLTRRPSSPSRGCQKPVPFTSLFSYALPTMHC